MLYGQPLHAFDYDTLERKALGVRPAREGEVLVTLDGSERHLSASDIVITDQDQAVALAGVMGGIRYRSDRQDPSCPLRISCL